MFLIGFMGCGKTTLGKGIAKKMQWDFVDMDEVIESRVGIPVSEIFATRGEAFFREQEHLLVKELVSRERVVVSTGGGVPCFHDNMDLINQHGVSVYIRLAPGVLASRLSRGVAKRPLLKGKTGEELLEHVKSSLHCREPFYLKATHQISGVNLQPDDIIALFT